MARRKRKKQSSSSNPIPIIIGVVCAILLLGAGFFYVTRSKPTNANPLNAETYTKNPSALTGSTFTVKGEVVKKLHYEEGVTQVIHVSYQNEEISIIIPDKVKGPNINTKQEYTFTVTAKNDDWLVAKAYTDK